MVLMPQYISDTHDLRPWNLRLTLLPFPWNATGGLRHNLHAALNAMSQKPIAAKIVETLISDGPLRL